MNANKKQQADERMASQEQLEHLRDLVDRAIYHMITNPKNGKVNASPSSWRPIGSARTASTTSAMIAWDCMGDCVSLGRSGAMTLRTVTTTSSQT